MENYETQSQLYFGLPKCIINCHVHGRDMEQAHKSTILQTIYEAALSGVGIICLMPNTQPAITSLEVLQIYFKLIDRARECFGYAVSVYVWFAVTDANLAECTKALADQRVPGLKIYPFAETCGVASPATIVAAMRLARDADKVVEIHCDNPAIISAEGHTVRAETEDVKMAITCARQVPGVRVTIAHVSCRASAELILQAQTEGLRIAIELCPQYLWFDEAGTNWRPGLDKNYYQCLNRLRSPADREFLVSLLSQDNNLIIIASDHAPHAKAEKLAGANGIPTLFETAPVLLTLAIRNNLSSLQVAKLLSFNAADHLGLAIDRELENVELCLGPDNFLYNRGAVVNPWQGTELYLPVRKEIPPLPEIIF